MSQNTYLLKYKLPKYIKDFLSQIILILVSISCIFPLLWMFSAALKTQSTVFTDMSLFPKNPEWYNFVIAWTKANFGTYFFNSLFYTVIVVFGVIFIGSLAAYAFSRLKFPFRNLFFLLFMATMMIPIPGSFISLYVLLTKLQLINTRVGYILPQINSGLAMTIFMLKTFFDKMPKDLEDAAKIDGCNKFGVYYHVALPLAKQAIAVMVIFTALSVWNEYLLAMLILSSKSLMPLQRGLMVFQGSHLTEYPLLMAGITITVVPIIVIYLLMQKYIIKGVMAGAIKE
ncbi:MAG: carbohydrate ABC transporter permease [Elusimicrobiota bacterium]|jgi:multiple sugar transport system permease protein/raffinose/stachyose/melibiose transport system permease protein|nr:carbohydrate ABC transporter permease [Elusimicrobiota bacterium]